MCDTEIEICENFTGKVIKIEDSPLSDEWFITLRSDTADDPCYSGEIKTFVFEHNNMQMEDLLGVTLTLPLSQNIDM